MHKLAWTIAPFAIVVCLFDAALFGQSATVSFSVYTEPPGARFAVDGQIYTSAATFQWPAGSKHYVRFVQDLLPSSAIVSTDATAPTLSPVQVSPDGAAVYTFNGFMDANGLLTPTGDPNQVITADPSMTSLRMSVSLNYRILLNFFDSPPATTPPSCGAPGSIPANEFRVGLVFINSQCFWNNAILYFPANSTLQLNAFPYPGFVFTGWSGNLGSSTAPLRTYTLKGPLTLAPVFQTAKRVRFETSPLGLQVLVDRTPSPTLSSDDPTTPCPHNEGLPVMVPSTFTALCRGDFDFAPGSAHLVGAPTPQTDVNGKTWVFDSWGSGQGQNAVYTAGYSTAMPDKVTVKFVPGVQASFVTSPPGLKLTIDGRDNWPGYNFVWATGSTHQIAAPLSQFDSQGRKFTFKSWSNSGSVSQTITMDPAAASSGFRMIANYDGLGRVVVQTSPPGLKVQVEGTDCQTPCIFDRPNGTQLRIAAPSSIAAADGVRLDFSSWSDSGSSDHMYTLDSDSHVLTAVYNTSFRLTALSDPPSSVNYTFDPVSSDLFYPADSQVNVTVLAKPGYKFRRWDGDLAGTYRSGVLTMSEPHSVLALVDRVPYIAPAGVRNAAGDTPDGTVAPGSLIAISGESLAPGDETGRVNPLAQTIAGVTVTVLDRLLPLVSVSQQRIIAQLPSDLTDGDYTLQVHSDGQPDVNGTFTVVRNAPGLLHTNGGDSYSVATHQDGTPVTSDSPAITGELITVMGTGFGPYVSPVIDGFFPPTPAPVLADPVLVSLGDVLVNPAWSGAASGYTGVNATRFIIPAGMPSGSNVDLKVMVNGQSSNTVVLPLQ